MTKSLCLQLRCHLCNQSIESLTVQKLAFPKKSSSERRQNQIDSRRQTNLMEETFLHLDSYNHDVRSAYNKKHGQHHFRKLCKVAMSKKDVSRKHKLNLILSHIVQVLIMLGNSLYACHKQHQSELPS